MASGYGLRGGIGRCYPFYADFKKCMSMRDDTSHPLLCFPEREDYFECLHGRKEHKMIADIQAQERIMQKQNRRYQAQEKEMQSLEKSGDGGGSK